MFEIVRRCWKGGLCMSVPPLPPLQPKGPFFLLQIMLNLITREAKAENIIVSNYRVFRGKYCNHIMTSPLKSIAVKPNMNIIMRKKAKKYSCISKWKPLKNCPVKYKMMNTVTPTTIQNDNLIRWNWHKQQWDDYNNTRWITNNKQIVNKWQTNNNKFNNNGFSLPVFLQSCE